MTHTTEQPAPSPATPALFVCPYCGGATPDQPRCTNCRGFLDPLSRQASQNAMGAWFIRNPESPFQSGCSYDTILTLVARGRIALDAVLRGPTTHQFWSPAKRVPGVAHLLGLCHSCGCDVEPSDPHCPECHAEFHLAHERQDLGLMPLRALPGGPALPSTQETVPPPPAPPHADPSPALLRHVAALEGNVRWLWAWLFAAFAALGILSALVAAAYFSGLASINPDFQSKPRAVAPSKQSPEPQAPSRQPDQPSDSKPAEPSPAASPSAESAPPSPEPTPRPIVSPAPANDQSATLAKAEAFIAEDTPDALAKAVSLLESLPKDAPKEQTDRAASLIAAAKARITQKQLSGVR